MYPRPPVPDSSINRYLINGRQFITPHFYCAGGAPQDDIKSSSPAQEPRGLHSVQFLQHAKTHTCTASASGTGPGSEFLHPFLDLVSGWSASWQTAHARVGGVV